MSFLPPGKNAFGNDRFPVKKLTGEKNNISANGSNHKKPTQVSTLGFASGPDFASLLNVPFF